MSEQEKQYFPGLDLLKFILALLIISAHCHLFLEFPNGQHLWGCLTAIAVPLFFGISSFLFYSKLNVISSESQSFPIFLRSIKRLSILFISWYVLMLPMTYYRFFSVATWKEIIYAVFMSSCFNGYWFIKALLINIAIIYLFRKNLSFIICCIIAFCIYMFCAYNYIYHFIPKIEALHPYYSFYYHTAYCCCGALFVRFHQQIHFEKWPISILLALFCCLYILSSYNIVTPFFRLISFVLIFPVFYQLNMSFCSNSIKRLRDMSIILYMTQFIIIWIYDGICNMWIMPFHTPYKFLQLSIIRFFIVLIVTVLIAHTILTLERNKHLSYLQYLH